MIKQLADIQSNLKAPKGQTNSFGKYKYRSCEDILEAVKPLLGDLVLTLSDDIVLVGDRVYVKCTASLTDGEKSISNTAFAREAATKKGMDDSQITGTASSYARKYALNGLFLIDDTKDADTDQYRNQSNSAPMSIADKIDACNSTGELVNLHKTLSEKERQDNGHLFSTRKAILEKGTN